MNNCRPKGTRPKQSVTSRPNSVKRECLSHNLEPHLSDQFSFGAGAVQVNEVHFPDPTYGTLLSDFHFSSFLSTTNRHRRRTTQATNQAEPPSIFTYPRSCSTTNLHSDSQCQQQEQHRPEFSASSTRDNSGPDFGYDAFSDWFLFNGNHNFDPDFGLFDGENNICNLDNYYQYPSNQQYFNSSSLTPESFFENDALEVWGCPPATIPASSKSGPGNRSLNASASGTTSQNVTPPNPTLQWNESMTTTAHSNFFGLDLDLSFGGSVPYAVTDGVLAQAQENLSQWTQLTDSPIFTSDKPQHTSTRESRPEAGEDSLYTPIKPSPLQKTISSSTESSVGAPSTSTSPIAKHTKTHQSPKVTLTDPTSSKITKDNSKPQQPKQQFHFVANSDKKTATRLRNTMTSRNLRQSKISRIAQLERELELQKAESEKWRGRALNAGWSGSGVDEDDDNDDGSET